MGAGSSSPTSRPTRSRSFSASFASAPAAIPTSEGSGAGADGNGGAGGGMSVSAGVNSSGSVSSGGGGGGGGMMDATSSLGNDVGGMGGSQIGNPSSRRTGFVQPDTGLSRRAVGGAGGVVDTAHHHSARMLGTTPGSDIAMSSSEVSSSNSYPPPGGPLADSAVGNTHYVVSANHSSIMQQERGAVPVPASDPPGGLSQWSDVDIEKLFDDEYLQSVKLPENQNVTVAGSVEASASSGVLAGAMPSTQGAHMAFSSTSQKTGAVASGSDGQNTNVSGSRSSIPVLLADVDPQHTGSHAHTQLSLAVSSQCRQVDAYSTRHQRQMHALQQIHISLSSMWDHHDRPIFKAGIDISSSQSKQMEKGKLSEAEKTTTTTVSTPLTTAVRAGMSSLPPTIHLGVFMFHTLLDCINSPTTSQNESRELLHATVPIIRNLGLLGAPLGIASSEMKESGGSISGTLDAHRDILDAIRNFLLRCSLPSSHECGILLKANVLTAEERRAAGKMAVADRTAALSALVELAFIRGSLCDLLMAIRVMICVAWTEKMREKPSASGENDSGARGSSDASSMAKTNAVHIKGKSVGQGAINPKDNCGDPVERVILKGQLRVPGGKVVKGLRGDKSPGVVDIEDESKSTDIIYDPEGDEQDLERYHGITGAGNDLGGGVASGVGVAVETTTGSSLNSTGSNQKQMRLMHAKKLQAATDPTNNTNSLSGARVVAQAAVVDVRNNGHQVSSDDPWEESWDGTQDIVVEPLLEDLPIVKFLRNIQSGSNSNLRAMSTSAQEGNRVDENAEHENNRSSGERQSNDGFGSLRRGVGGPSEMWTFGQNSYGELVHGDTNSRKTPAKVGGLGIGSFGGDSICQVAAGNEHTCMLTESGLVLMAGYNDNGQCGLGTTERVESLTVIESLRDKDVVQVHAYNGCEHTLVVTRDGKLYAFGYNYRGQLGLGSTSSVFMPQLVRGLGNKKVRSVGCSYYHSMISCADGSIYGFGRNDFGQIGLGDLVDRKEPTLVDVPGLKGNPAKDIACGQYHTLVLAKSGSAWVCGKNDYGQLGLSSNEPQTRFVKLDISTSNLDSTSSNGTTAGGTKMMDSSRVVSLKTGYYHSLALLENGNVLSCGRNDYGQLGHGHTTQRVFGLQSIEMLQGKGVSMIACGCYHSLAVATGPSAPGLYIFGRNNHGQLGTGDDIERHTPCLIPQFANKCIVNIAAGFYHTIIITRDSDNITGELHSVLGNRSDQWPSSPLLYNAERNRYMSRTESDIWESPLGRTESQTDVIKNEQSINAAEAANFLATHLDEMVKSYKFSGSNVSALDPKHTRISNSTHIELHQNNAQNGHCKSIFALDPSPGTFSALLALIAMCDRGKPDADVSWSVDLDSSRLQTLLTSLRLLHANLAEFLQKKSTAMLDLSAPSEQAEESALGHTFAKLKRCLFRILEHPSHFANVPPGSNAKGLVKHLQATSARVLIVGLQVFYPEPQDILNLFTSLIDAPIQGPLPKLLLVPLLIRLSEDKLVQSLFPHTQTSAMRFESHNSDSTKYSDKSCFSDLVPAARLVSAAMSFLGSPGQVPTNPSDKENRSIASKAHICEFVLKVILCVQKHLLSWAGSHGLRSDRHVIFPTAKAKVNTDFQNGCSTGVSLTPVILRLVHLCGVDMQHEVNQDENSCDDSILPGGDIVIIEANDVPPAWSVLIEYSQLIMQSSVSFLNAASDNFSGMSASNTKQMLFQTGKIFSNLHASLVGTVLRPLILGLSLFGSSNGIASAILPSVSQLLESSDRVVQCCIRHGILLPEYASYTAYKTFCDCEQKRKVLGRNSTSSGQVPSLKEVLWLLDLNQLVACLASKFSKTLLIAEQASTNKGTSVYPSSKSTEDAYGGFGDLFVGGMETWALSAFDKVFKTTANYANYGGYVDRVLRMFNHVDAPLSDSSPHQKLNNPLSLQCQRSFIHDVVKGVGAGGLLVEVVRKAYASKNVSYKMTLRLMKGEKKHCELAERAAFGAALKLSSLTTRAMSLARCLSAIKSKNEKEMRPREIETTLLTSTHRSVLSAWKVAADVRQRLVKHRLHNPTFLQNSVKMPTGPNVRRLHSMPLEKQLKNKARDFRQLAKHVGVQSCFAMCFRDAANPLEGCMLSPSGNTAEPCITESNQMLQIGVTSRYDGLPFLRRYPRSRWRKVRILFFIICRFRRLGKCHVKLETSEDELLSAKLKKIANFILPSNIASPMSLQTLSKGACKWFIQAADASRRAIARASGLSSYEILLNSVQTHSAKVELLRTLSPGLRDHPNTAGDVFTSLKLANHATKDAVWNAFTSLFQSILDIISSVHVMPDDNGHSLLDAGTLQLVSLALEPWCLLYNRTHLQRKFFCNSGICNVVRKLMDRHSEHMVQKSTKLESDTKLLGNNSSSSSNNNNREDVDTLRRTEFNRPMSQDGQFTSHTSKFSKSSRTAGLNRTYIIPIVHDADKILCSQSTNISSGTTSSNLASMSTSRNVSRNDQRAFIFESAERVFQYLIMQLGMWEDADLKGSFSKTTPAGDGNYTLPKKSCIHMLFDVLYNDLHASLTKFCSLLSRDTDLTNSTSPSPRGKYRDKESVIESSTDVNQPGNNDISTTVLPSNAEGVYANARGSSSRPLHSQDVIDQPRYISASEPGIAIPITEQLVTNTSGDFSLTFWILVAQESTGFSRSILLRGSEVEFSPLIVLRPHDRCIEVRLSRRNGVYMPGLSGAENMASEKLTSKTAIPLFVWTHVALVAEASQLRVYINGVLDAQRTNYTNTFPNASSGLQMPLYVGKLPNNIVSPKKTEDVAENATEAGLEKADLSQKVLQGFDGSMAKLRFHARALSPIHVRVDSEKGAPLSPHIPDDDCFQLLLLLMLTTRSQMSRSILSEKRWILLLFQVAKYGTNRTKLASLRIIRHIISGQARFNDRHRSTPIIKPCFLNETLGLEDIGGFASWLLREIGSSVLVLMSAPRDKKSSLYLEDRSDFRASFLKMHHRNFRIQSPNNVIQNPSDQISTALMSAREATHFTFSQVSEVVSLLRYLARINEVWCSSIQDAVTRALQDVTDSTGESSELSEQMALAAIIVLGGNLETLRVGAKVSLSHTDLSATLINLKSDLHTSSGLLFASSAEVAIGRRGPQISTENHLQYGTLKSISMSTDELIVVNGTEMPIRSGLYGKQQLRGLVATLSWLLGLQKHSEVSNELLGEKESALSLKGNESLLTDEAITKWWKQSAKEKLVSPASPRRAQILSSLLKCLHVLYSRDEENTRSNSLAFDITSLILEEQSLFRDMLQLSIYTQTCENNSQFFTSLTSSMIASSENLTSRPMLTLEEAGYATVLLRQRLVALGLQRAEKGQADLQNKDAYEYLVGTGDQISGHMTAISENDFNSTLSSSYSAPLSDVSGRAQQSLQPDSGGESKSGSASTLSLLPLPHGTRRPDNQHVFDPPEEMVEELMTMGFPREWCITALREKENDMVDASTWIVDNLDFLGSNLAETNGENASGNNLDVDQNSRDDMNDSNDSNNIADEQHQQDVADMEKQVLLSGGGVDVIASCREYFPGDIQHGMSWYDNSSGSNCARQSRFQAIAAAISAVADSNVRQVLLEAEHGLAAMYAQYIVLDVFQYWLKSSINPAMSPERPLSATTVDFKRVGIDNILRFAKVSLLTGEMMRHSGEESLPSRELLLKAYPHLIEHFGSVDVQSRLKDALIHMLNSSLQSEHVSSISEARAGIVALSIYEMQKSDLGMPQQRAADVGKFKGIFDSTSENPDLDILYMCPSAAFSEWCLDIFLSTLSYENVDDEKLLISLYEEYSQHINSSYLLIGEFVFSGLSKMLRCQMTSEKPAADTGIFSKMVPTSLIQTILLKRVRIERSNGRMLHSVYLQQLEELLLSLKIYGANMGVKSEPQLMKDRESKVEGKIVEQKIESLNDSEEDLPFHEGLQAKKHKIKFDQIHCGPSIRISEDGMSASFSSSESWSTVLGNQGFSQGKNYWEIRIDRSPTAYLFVGVALQQANLSTFLGGDDCGWGYIGDRALYHSRSKLKLYGDRFGQGDVIGITLDMDDGTLSFSRNGMDLGVAIQHLSGVIYPAVAFYNRGQQVSFVSKSFRLGGAGIGLPGSPADASLDCIIEGGEIFKAAASPNSSIYKFPTSFIQCAYDDYCCWIEGSTKRYLTQCGLEVQLSVSDEECAALSEFLHGDRVRSARGMCTICGVAGGKLWRLVDGEKYVWFFGEKELLSARLIKAAPGTEIVKSNVTSKIASGGTKRCLRTSQKTIEISYSQFADIIKNTWTSESLLVDANVVRAANDLCERPSKQQTAKLGLLDNGESDSPWNISCEEFTQDVIPLARKYFSQDQSLADPAEMNPKLHLAAKHFDERSVMARWAIVRMLNKQMLPIYPFVNLSEIFNLSLVSHPHLLTSQEATSIRSSVGMAICMVRRLLFLHTKKSLLRRALDRTVTHPKKAEDDYDYPEDLATVVLCRPKAVLAKSLPDAETRLSYSVFGQAFDELHFLEPSALRMAYTHPMDDGQERTFKVKFEGEGVDDYGGPYREFFSTVCGEIQALAGKVDSNNTNLDDLNEDDQSNKCVLPLLVPCINAQRKAGECQSHFVINPRTCRLSGGSSQLYKEMYSFVGQFIGIALRSNVSLDLSLPSVFWKVLVGEELNWMDLQMMDMPQTDVLRELHALISSGQLSDSSSGQIDEDELIQDILDELNWSTRTSDGSTVDVRSGRVRSNTESDSADLEKPTTDTKAERVWTSESLQRYIAGVIRTRLLESESAIRAVSDGLRSVVPACGLALFSWWELELQVCGRREIDIDLLRKNTEYDDDVNENDPVVSWLWEVLEEFTHDQRRDFLRFCWARSHLPASASDFRQKFKIQSPVTDGARQKPDMYLPKAHTCFFSINLPKYSSKKVLKTKLQYAISECFAMDADFALQASEATEGVWSMPPSGES